MMSNYVIERPGSVPGQLAIEFDIGAFFSPDLLLGAIGCPLLAGVEAVVVEGTMAENGGEGQDDAGIVHAVHQNELDTLVASQAGDALGQDLGCRGDRHLDATAPDWLG